MAQYEQKHPNRPFNLAGEAPGQEKIRRLREKEGGLLRKSLYRFEEDDYDNPKTGHRRDYARSESGHSLGQRDVIHPENRHNYYPNPDLHRRDLDGSAYYDEGYADQNAYEPAYPATEAAEHGYRMSEYRNSNLDPRANYKNNQYSADMNLHSDQSHVSPRSSFHTLKDDSFRVYPVEFNAQVERREPGHSGHSQRGKGPKNYTRSDERIREDANKALFDSHSVDASDIEVSVDNGVLVLSGTVESRYAKRSSETAVEDISGVQNIENRLHVR